MMMRGFGPVIGSQPVASAISLAVPFARGLFEGEPKIRVVVPTERAPGTRPLRESQAYKKLMGAGSLKDGMKDLAEAFVTKDLSGRTVLSRNLYAFAAPLGHALLGIFYALMGLLAPLIVFIGLPYASIRDGLKANGELSKWWEGVNKQYSGAKQKK